jgi:hypothetical protein
MGPFASVIALFAGHYAASYVFALYAGQRFGNRDYWYTRFLHWPVIGHIECLLLLFCPHDYEKRFGFIEVDLDDLRRRAEYLSEKQESDREENSVTPFKSSVYHIWVDPKVEEYLDWNMPRKALKVARDRLNNAKDAGCRKSVRLYKDYIRAIKVQLNHPQSKGNLMPAAKKEGLQMSNYKLRYIPPANPQRPIRIK